jgi:hypothetical protein
MHRAGALLAFVWLGAAVAAEPAVPMADLSIEMRPIDADVLFKKYPYDKSSFGVTLVEPDGKRLPGRIEVKGKSSRLVPKKGPLIKLDKPGKWRGNGRISMNALATDPSMMREWLAWDLIHRLGMVAPEVEYTFLRINGQDMGLFLRIEWFGPGMFKRYGHESGQLYDPEDTQSCGDLSVESLPQLDYCWAKLFPDADFGPLANLIRAVDAEPPETFDRFMEREFDVESVVNWIAVTVVTSNLTTYNNEYWPYRSDTTGKWLVVPWDYDRTFGKNADPWQPYPGFVFNSNFQYYYPLELGASNAVRDKMFKNPALSRRIRQRIAEILDGTPDAAHPWRGWFAPAAIQQRIDRLYAFIKPLRGRDPFLVGLDAVFEEEVAALRHYATARHGYLRRVVLEGGGGERDVGTAAWPAPGATAQVIDGFGFLLAQVTPRGRGTGALAARVQRGSPELVPPGIAREACVQRSWLIDGPGGVEADLLVEYLQEFQRTSEVGPQVRTEGELALYARDPRGWWQLPTTGNALANTLRATARFPSRGPLRLVACTAPSPAELATAGGE